MTSFKTFLICIVIGSPLYFLYLNVYKKTQILLYLWSNFQKNTILTKYNVIEKMYFIIEVVRNSSKQSLSTYQITNKTTWLSPWLSLKLFWRYRFWSMVNEVFCSLYPWYSSMPQHPVSIIGLPSVNGEIFGFFKGSCSPSQRDFIWLLRLYSSQFCGFGCKKPNQKVSRSYELYRRR